eukprot:239624-Chlamydomonas_euryale.AAC.1
MLFLTACTAWDASRKRACARPGMPAYAHLGEAERIPLCVDWGLLPAHARKGLAAARSKHLRSQARTPSAAYTGICVHVQAQAQAQAQAQ